MNYLETLKQNEQSFLIFISKKYSFYYHSNLFLRDIQYAINSFFKFKGIELGFSATEKLAFEFAEYMEQNNKFTKINNSTWKVMIDISPKVEENLEAVENE